jgi:hypothetical protein
MVQTINSARRKIKSHLFLRDGFDVEPRGIEPLNPNVKCELPHQWWPQELHKNIISKIT